METSLHDEEPSTVTASPEMLLERDRSVSMTFDEPLEDDSSEPSLDDCNALREQLCSYLLEMSIVRLL